MHIPVATFTVLVSISQKRKQQQKRHRVKKQTQFVTAAKWKLEVPISLCFVETDIHMYSTCLFS